MLDIFRIPLEILLELEKQREEIRDNRPTLQLPVPELQPPPYREEEEKVERGIVIIEM